MNRVATRAREVARYSDLTRLPGTTGSQIQRQMATLKARLIARYNLQSVAGRPEELTGQIVLPTRTMGQVVSLGYGCGTIRIRKHGGDRKRDWIDYIDIQLNDGWHSEVYNYLDDWFGYKQS